MINVIPVFGWVVSLALSMFLAVPLWFLWTKCGLGSEYFGFLPPRYLDIEFWNIVGLLMLISILKAVLLPCNLITVENKK